MKQIGAVVRYNFLGFWKNPRVALTFLLGFIACFLLSEKVMDVADYFQTPMQAAEPFLWTFGDSTSLLLVSLLLLLFFSDVPKLGPVSPYYLHRSSKKKWLAAQFLYVAAGTGLYVGFVLLSTTVLCVRYTFLGNQWSETAALLGYSEMGEELMVPSTVKVMESISPYGCMAQVAGLLFLYALTLGFLVLLGNLLFEKPKGLLLGLGYSLYGFLLNPNVIGAMLGIEDHEMYRIRVLAGWISPVNHATYAMHNFGYDLLPTVGVSLVLFALLLGLIYLGAARRLRTYNFVFLGGLHE